MREVSIRVPCVSAACRVSARGGRSLCSCSYLVLPLKTLRPQVGQKLPKSGYNCDAVYAKVDGPWRAACETDCYDRSSR